MAWMEMLSEEELAHLHFIREQERKIERRFGRTLDQIIAEATRRKEGK